MGIDCHLDRMSLKPLARRGVREASVLEELHGSIVPGLSSHVRFDVGADLRPSLFVQVIPRSAFWQATSFAVES